MKTIAAGVTGSLTGVGQVAASGNSAKRTGVAYDPQTHEILGPASAQLNPIHEELRGTLRLGEKKIKLNQAQPVTESTIDNGDVHVKYQQITDSDTDGLNELVNVMGFESGGVTGYVRNPNGRRVAFALDKESASRSQRKMEKHVKNAGLITGGGQ